MLIPPSGTLFPLVVGKEEFLFSFLPSFLLSFLLSILPSFFPSFSSFVFKRKLPNLLKTILNEMPLFLKVHSEFIVPTAHYWYFHLVFMPFYLIKTFFKNVSPLVLYRFQEAACLLAFLVSGMATPKEPGANDRKEEPPSMSLLCPNAIHH